MNKFFKGYLKDFWNLKQDSKTNLSIYFVKFKGDILSVSFFYIILSLA